MTDADLDRWLAAALAAAGADPAAGLVDSATVEVVLDLAREAAHRVTRPAAPLAAFAVGLALGAGATPDDVRAAAARVEAAARSWPVADGDG